MNKRIKHSSFLFVIHHLSFYLLLLSLPLQLGRHFWFDFSYVRGIRIDYLSPTLYLTDILILAILIFWLIDTVSLRGARFRATWQSFFNTLKKRKLMIGLLAVFISFNILLSISPWLTLYKWIKVLELGLLAWYVSRNYRALVIGHWLLVITLIYSFLIAFSQFIHSGSLGGVLWWLGERTFSTSTPGIALVSFGGHQFLRPYATFSHPNVMAGYSLVITTLLITHVPQIKLFWNRFFIFLGVFSGIGIIILSASRAAWIVGSVTLFGLFLLSHSGKRARERIQNHKPSSWFYPGSGFWTSQNDKVEEPNLKIFIYLSLVISSLFFILQYILQFDETVQTRHILNTLAWKSFLMRPLVGTGLGTFISSIPLLSPISSNALLQPVHNIVLLLLSETGFVGLLFGVLIAYSVIKKACALHWVYILILVQVFALSMVDHYFFTIQQSQLLLAIIVGLIAQQNKPIIQSSNNPINKIK